MKKSKDMLTKMLEELIPNQKERRYIYPAGRFVDSGWANNGRCWW